MSVENDLDSKNEKLLEIYEREVVEPLIRNAEIKAKIPASQIGKEIEAGLQSLVQLVISDQKGTAYVDLYDLDLPVKIKDEKGISRPVRVSIRFLGQNVQVNGSKI